MEFGKRCKKKPGTHPPFFLAPVFIEQLLYCITYTLFGAEMNRVDKNSCLHRAYRLAGETNSERDKEEKYSRCVGTKTKGKNEAGSEGG